MKRINPFVKYYQQLNNGTNEEKYKLVKEGIVNLPRILDVEFTNLCNFNCCFCPTGTRSMKRMKGFMPKAVSDKLVESVKKYHIPGVRVIGWGEPTLHPEWLDILENIHTGGGIIHLGTNGSRLSEDNIKALIDMQIESIKFSFQGADAESYNEMRDGGDYDTLIETVKTMYKLRGDLMYPYIQISTTLTVESEEQVKNFRTAIEPYCDYCNIGYTMLNHLSVDAMNVSEEKKEKIRKMQEHESINHTYRKVCSDAFDKLDLHWNGDMTLCCSDYENFLLVGNIMDMDVKEIFNSNIANLYRDVIVKGEYGKIECCSNCYETVPLTK